MADSKVAFYSFDETRETVENYLERFNLYCELQDYKPETKQQLLLTYLLSELYTKLKELLRPQEIAKIPFKQVESLLAQLYTKLTNTTTERYTFQWVVQQLGQAIRDCIDQFYTKSTKCKFGSFENETLKDQLVLGVIDNSLRKRLLQEDGVTFEKATNLALQFETAESQSKLLTTALKISYVNAVGNQNKDKRSQYTKHNVNTRKVQSKPIECTSCEYSHPINRCPGYGKL